MIVIKTESPAKINLTLEIIRKMSNGFHELRTVMVKLINLKDELEFRIKPGTKKITIECDNPEIPFGKGNICYKAASLFLDVLDKEIEVLIKIKKNIPIGAGLGGGSSDAASTFKVLNEYFKKPFSQKQLILMAAEVGKDVPFFLSKKNGALIKGAGEIIKKNFHFNKGCFLLVNPGINISTKEAFGKISEKIKKFSNKKRNNISEKMLVAIKSRIKDDIINYFYNDFESSIKKTHPVIKEIKQNLLNFGAKGSLMSGSGATVFGWFESKKEALDAQKKIKNRYQRFLVEIG